MTTWTSLRRPLANDGRSGRSISRQVRIASSHGRPSRRKNEPGMRPAAYIRSSTSIGEREEVELLLGVLAGGGGGQQHGVVVEVRDDGAGGLLGQPAGLEADGAGAEATVVDDRHGLVDRWLSDTLSALPAVVRPAAAEPASGDGSGAAGLRSERHAACVPGATTEDRRRADLARRRQALRLREPGPVRRGAVRREGSAPGGPLPWSCALAAQPEPLDQRAVAGDVGLAGTRAGDDAGRPAAAGRAGCGGRACAACRCSVRSEIRWVSIATWTSGEPVSLSAVAYSDRICCFTSLASATPSPSLCLVCAAGRRHGGRLHTAPDGA